MTGKTGRPRGRPAVPPPSAIRALKAAGVGRKRATKRLARDEVLAKLARPDLSWAAWRATLAASIDAWLDAHPPACDPDGARRIETPAELFPHQGVERDLIRAQLADPRGDEGDENPALLRNLPRRLQTFRSELDRRAERLRKRAQRHRTPRTK